MQIPVSWLKDFVQINMPLEELAHELTMAGLEVEGIHYVGLPVPGENNAGPGPGIKITGMGWDQDKIVVAVVHEVMPHPNADRLVLCRLDDGEREHVVLTGAPNLYPYKGAGPLDKPLMVPYAREGARLIDGHQPGQVMMTLKRAKIRGVESYSMICSEKELGISDDHEGIIILDDDAVVGTPLSVYMGDAVLDIAITPNIARDANMVGVAREIAALTGQTLNPPSYDFTALGQPIEGQVSIEIRNPELNPRFVLGLIRDVKIGPSPYWVQRRLRLTGMRPIDNIVDATNYAMLEIGQPLHAFDFDILVKRAGGKVPKIITRTARDGEKLTTLDDVDHILKDFTVLVCDTEGALAVAGVMGGAESEVQKGTRNVLLEGAAWNFINIRRTIADQRMNSEAAYRFSRGVHPAMAERGVQRGLEFMRQWSGGVIAAGLVDNYPLPPVDPVVEITTKDVERWLGIELTLEQMADILNRLDFRVEILGETLRATTPDHRLDIGQGITGVADMMEEIARIYGYERIPETRMADELPPQLGNPYLEKEESIRDLLVNLGLQEVVSYRLTSPEREARLHPKGHIAEEGLYDKLTNPIASDRNVLRRSMLSSVMEIVERNARNQERIALFEIGPVFLPSEEGDLPEEQQRLVIAITGPRELAGWQAGDTQPLDFYDLKGTLVSLLAGMKISDARFEPAESPVFHPGKCARINLGEKIMGIMGVLHPLVSEHYDLPETPLVAADLNLKALIDAIPGGYIIEPVPAFPPVLEDIAVIVDEDIPAERVLQSIRGAGSGMLVGVKLFDVYRGEQIAAGKKSLAYSLAFQTPERTLTDKEVAKIRERIVTRLGQDLGAKLRG